MNKAFEKILERLEERRKLHADLSISDKLSVEEQEIQSRICGCFSKSKQIVQEVAEEYNGGWIPCSERLPEENQKVMLQDFYGNITIETMKTNNGTKGFRDGYWWSSANNYIAWQPLPGLYIKEVN